MNLPELVDDFLDYLFSVRGYSEKTVETYEIPLRQMLERCRPERSGKGWRLDLLPLRRVIASNSRRTVAKKLSAVRSFVKYLNDQRGIPVTLEGADSVKVPQTLPKPLEEEYIREVWGAADPLERLLLGLLYGLGLRIGEVAGLEREGIRSEWVTVKGKGGKSRQLPLPPAIRKILEEYLAVHPGGRYLFEKGGVPMNSGQLRYRLQRLFRSHGIRATPHQLRHSFATHLLEHGARISDVSELLGHSSMATTQIYTKLGSVKKMEEYRKAHPLAYGELRMENGE
ncbi:tyrosine-type recombinase/integrase [Nitratifractor sp.]